MNSYTVPPSRRNHRASTAREAEIDDDAAAVSEAEFATLRDTLQVSDSVLSKHVSALVAVGYVNTRKGIRAGHRTTWISLTACHAAGRRALSAHVAALRELIAGVE